MVQIVLEFEILQFHMKKKYKFNKLTAEIMFNTGNAKRGISPRLKIKPCDLDLWPWKSIGFFKVKGQGHRVKFLPHNILVNNLESRSLNGFWPNLVHKFQTPLMTKYVPSLVKTHWRMLILECSKGCYAVTICPCDLDLWPMTLKINRIPDSLKD
jgi:hypothetical protein